MRLPGVADPQRPRREHLLQPVDIYLDVDGVIIPVFDPDLGVDVARSGWRDWREQKPPPGRKRVAGLTQYSPAMVRRLKRLSEQEHVTVHWATTWRERAATELAPVIGLPATWDVIDRNMAYDRAEVEHRTVRSWWKRDAIKAHHAERPDHAIVWVDDDLGFDEDARLWVNRALGPRRALGISPDTMIGLTSHDLRRIEHFVLH